MKFSVSCNHKRKQAHNIMKTYTMTIEEARRELFKLDSEEATLLRRELFKFENQKQPLPSCIVDRFYDCF